jgi:hypothetical protein
MFYRFIISCLLVAISGLAKPVAAQGTGKGRVVLAPIASLNEGSSAKLGKVRGVIEEGIRKVAGELITAKAAANQANKAKRPELRSCEGDVGCLSQLGALVSAQSVVYAEVGGLGDAQVVYLKLIDVGTAKEVRSTTMELSASTNPLVAEGAATRLISPKSYVGSLQVTTGIEGAMIYVDGQKIAKTPSEDIPVLVGSHALRVTHPEHHDFVRFVDIGFKEKSTVEATLQPIAGISQRLAAEGVIGSGQNVKGQGEQPWYLRWYTITGGLLAIGVTSAIIMSTTGTIDADRISPL